MSRDTVAEEIRLRYRYRKLILRGELSLTTEAASALIGPDCAYHLYRRIGMKPLPPPGGKPGDR